MTTGIAQKNAHFNHVHADLDKFLDLRTGKLVWHIKNLNKKTSKDDYDLNHRFFTGGPWTPKESVEKVLRIHEDHKIKVLYPI